MDRAYVLRRLPFWVVLAAVYFVLPACTTGIGGRFLALICFLPGLTFVISWVYGIVNRFSWVFCTGATVLALPVMFCFYDSSTWYYALIYGAISFFACFVGGLWKKKG